ncbi:MAG: flagellar biosynthesis protein FlhB [Lautropia sp.]|nr:flagellar biosynthesis protein FlhB [Lautropia sp.]
MAESSRDDRQLPASEKRLKQARGEGNVPRSRDVSNLLVMLCGLSMLWWMGGALAEGLRHLLGTSFLFDAKIKYDYTDAVHAILGAFGQVAWRLLSILAVICLVAILASAVPGGFNVSTKAIGLKVSRLNPVSGLKRIFSLRNLVEFLKLSLLAGVMGAISGWYLLNKLSQFSILSFMSLGEGLIHAITLVSGGMKWLLLLLAVLAAFDAPFQWFRHRADLKMTREEVKQENRDQDGDPHLKGQIRSRQREAARRRMMSAVPSADIVIVNPTHYSVAIRYDETAGGAPRVVAKGVDEMAMRIQAIARESGVPVLSAPPLARALYAYVDLNHEIPQALYVAVAQVLVYVYQLKRWVPGQAPAPRAPDDLPVPSEMDPKSAKHGRNEQV